MKKNLLKFITSLFVVSVMVISMLPTTVCSAEEATNGIVNRTSTLDITSNSLEYMSTDGTKKTVDMNTTSVLDSAEGWSWDVSTRVLTLAGANITGEGCGIKAGGDDFTKDSLTINLAEGTENFVSASILDTLVFGIDAMYAALTINGSGTLNVTTPNITKGSSIFARSLLAKDLNVCENVKLNVTAGDAISTSGDDITCVSIAIVGSNITIYDHAKLNVKSGKAQIAGFTSAGRSVGLEADRNLIVKDDAIITVNAGEVIGGILPTSTGLYVDKMQVTGNANIKTTGNYGILAIGNASDSWGEIELSGNSKVEANGNRAAISTIRDTIIPGTLTINDNALLVAKGTRSALYGAPGMVQILMV